MEIKCASMATLMNNTSPWCVEGVARLLWSRKNKCVQQRFSLDRRYTRLQVCRVEPAKSKRKRFVWIVRTKFYHHGKINR